MSERKMWDQKEDSMIIKIVKENQTRSENQKLKWSEIAEVLQNRISGCRRTGKQCRERWYNHLNPAIIKDKELSRSEIDKLFELQDKLGNRWAVIAKQFPGRTDNNLKNFFYSSLRRAIRQINFFVAHYKKKSNIKPFKQSILTKVLNINDEKYRQKLDIKSQKAESLAQNVKQMLATLSIQQQEREERQLDQSDIEFRQKIVRAIQQFNKNCKKRKSKRVEQEEQPDLEEVSNSNQKSQSMEQARPSKKAQRERKPHNKVLENEQLKRPVKVLQNSPSPTVSHNNKQPQKNTRVQKYQNTSKTKQDKVDQQRMQNTRNKKLKTKESLIDELLDNENKLKPIDSKKSSSKYDSRSSGNQQFKLESSDFMRQSNASLAQLEPRMLTRRSSSEYKSSFLHNIENWRKMESKCQDGGLFAPAVDNDNLHILDPMLESLNIGDNLQRITEGSVTQSGLFKMINRESKTENQ